MPAMSDCPPPALTARLTLSTAVLESRRGPDLGEKAAPAVRSVVLALVLALLSLGAAMFQVLGAG
jgi:hypothetical protein